MRIQISILALLLSPPAIADEVQFSLNTAGWFHENTPNLVFQGIGSVANPGFTGTSSGGSVALDDLGRFTLLRPTQAADTYQHETFTLNVLFFLPSGISETSEFSG